jgi:hypothetical protein
MVVEIILTFKREEVGSNYTKKININQPTFLQSLAKENEVNDFGERECSTTTLVNDFFIV